MTFEETARNYQWLLGELEAAAQMPDTAKRLERLADLFRFYASDVLENQQISAAVERATPAYLCPAEPMNK